ncbi:MAG: DNA repair protein RecN [Gammaproteobacteria bacterium]|nr:DNA repair protein RecN [Gammaproteobacteria bacterium]
MITQIIIKNFAIIDTLDIELSTGMTALTGETGAGKSILLNAIQLILGDRADSDTVKSGCEKAEISVSFNLEDHSLALKWLKENELEMDNDIIIRRVINQNGRSKAYINGSPSPLSQLKTLGSLLVDLHGQHEHQSLQKAEVQLALLDSSIANESLLNNVAASYRQWKKTKAKLKDLLSGQAEKEQRIDLLTLYTKELNSLGLKQNELEALEHEHKILLSADELIQGSSEVAHMLYEAEEKSVQQQLNACLHKMNQLSTIDQQLNETVELINTAVIQIEEASSEINHYRDNIEHDNERLTYLDQRISTVFQLASKHHIETTELYDYCQKLNQELDDLCNDDMSCEVLQEQEILHKQSYLDIAEELNAERKSAASLLSKKITDAMQQLGMQGGQFNIKVDVTEKDNEYSAKGINQVLFEISANPGQSLKPLTRVASGGELSRMSLAIQVILSESSDINTLIFDEVDSGIGGGIAEIVGQKLRLIANNRQVLCVTHLPQVAAQAHHHFQVNKTKLDQQTTTSINLLSTDQRLDEVARMLGGINITAQTKAHAQEMIDSVN